jgi:hypothetical protein
MVWPQFRVLVTLAGKSTEWLPKPGKTGWRIIGSPGGDAPWSSMVGGVGRQNVAILAKLMWAISVSTVTVNAAYIVGLASTPLAPTKALSLRRFVASDQPC